MDIYHKITVLDMETSDYEVEINRALKKETKDKTKIELCGKTTSRNIKKITNDCIWWKDDDGMFHDETPQLPIKIREDADNIRIEKRGK